MLFKIYQWADTHYQDKIRLPCGLDIICLVWMCIHKLNLIIEGTWLRQVHQWIINSYQYSLWPKLSSIESYNDQCFVLYVYDRFASAVITSWQHCRALGAGGWLYTLMRKTERNAACFDNIQKKLIYPSMFYPSLRILVPTLTNIQYT